MFTDSTGFVLTDLARFFRHSLEILLNDAGLNLTVGEIRALDVVTASNGERQCDLASRLCVEPMTMSAYLDRLEFNGLVVRLPDPTDRRVKIVKPTAAATALAGKLARVTEEMQERITVGIDAVELRAVTKALLTMRENLRRASGDGNLMRGDLRAAMLAKV